MGKWSLEFWQFRRTTFTVSVPVNIQASRCNDRPCVIIYVLFFFKPFLFHKRPIALLMLKFQHSVNRVKNSKRNHAFCGVFLGGCASKSLLASSKYKNTVQHSMEGKRPLSGKIAFFCVLLGNAYKGKMRHWWQDVRKNKKLTGSRGREQTEGRVVKLFWLN